MTDITIKYDHGQMLIHLDNFLSDGKIAKVRKLLKLIRQSYTPECEEQIKEYLQCVIDKDKFHNNQMALAGKITNIESNIYILEKRLKAATLNRNAFKKSTPIHKNEDWSIGQAWKSGSVGICSLQQCKGWRRWKDGDL